MEKKNESFTQAQLAPSAGSPISELDPTRAPPEGGGDVPVDACAPSRMKAYADEIITHDPFELKNIATDEEIILPQEGKHYTRQIVNAEDAWRISEGSADVVVAIVDSGVDVKHPDLRANLWINEKEKNGRKGVDDDGNGFVDDVHGWDFVLNKPLAVDGTGHGTHCAGNVGAVKNGLGVIGVSPRVKIMGVRFLNSSGSGSTENAIKAIQYAVANGARVISNSWGGGGTVNECLQQRIAQLTAKGIYFVASANNQGRNIDSTPSYPASYPGVIAVGNSDENDQRNSGSNYGKKSVLVFAPGTKSLSTGLSGTYREATGTSMAAPQIAGAIALGLAVKPNISMEQMKEELCLSANPKLQTHSKCGRLDLGEFVKRLSQL